MTERPGAGPATRPEVPPECGRARSLLLDAERGRLPAAEPAWLEEHLAGCAGCRAEAEAERALSAALATRLPRHRPSPELLTDLAARYLPAAAQPAPAPRSTSPSPATDVAGPGAVDSPPAPAPLRPVARRWPRPAWLGPAMAAALVLATVGYYEGLVLPRRTSPSIAAEAVHDHLRLLASSHPLGVESGGPHQVKPWFQGRLDFAPPLAFGGDDDYPLVGGDVAYVFDRKAAQLVFRRRLHTISLLVFVAEGLRFPPAEVPLGRLAAHLEEVRGFSSVVWRDGELGFALASDLNRAELLELARRVASAGR